MNDGNLYHHHLPSQVLNVAEKNDAAKNIAEIMSGGGARRREGFSVYNKIYEFGSMVQVARDKRVRARAKVRVCA